MIRDIIHQTPGCNLSFGPPIVIGNSVTLVPKNGNGTLEYSSDGNLWQASPTFNNVPKGTKRFYIRERDNTFCSVAGYVPVTGCISNWQNTENPPFTNCIGGFIHNYQQDGCGNFRFDKTNVACGGGCVPGQVVDVSPQETLCVNGFIQIKTTDGCNFGYRATTTSCACVTPVGPANVVATPSTCNQAGQFLNNGSFTYGPVTNANRYAFYLPGSGSAPTYANATAIPQGGTISVNNIPGSSSLQAYILVLFNGNDSCKLEKTVNVAATNCSVVCVKPVFTFDSVAPTCNGNIANADGKLRISGLTNGDRFQICEGTSFNCTPNYATATPISGSGQIIIKSNVGFGPSEAYKDFNVRVYNGSLDCYETKYVRVDNPCLLPGCTLPTNGTPVATPATCNGTVVNNDASISISGIANANKYGFSYGETYTGPNYASALNVSSGVINIGNITGSSNATNITVRMWNNNESCHKDVLVSVAGKTCNSGCTAPTLTIGSLPPTCSGGQSNQDGNVSINNIANGNRYQVCPGSVFNCTPNYSSATPFTGVGPILVVPQLGFLSTEQFKEFVVRVYNQSQDCFTDKYIKVNNPCYNSNCCTLTITNVQLTNV